MLLLTHSVLLLVHYYGVETCLCEIALDEKVEAARYASFSVTRLSLLFSCLRSTKEFFETFYEVPATVLLDLPYSTWTLLSHLNVVMSKLSLCIVDGWDLNYVSETLNLHAVLETMSGKVAEAVQIALRSQEDSTTNGVQRTVPMIFMTIDMKVKEIEAFHEARKAEISRRRAPGGTPSEQAQVGDESGMAAIPADFAMIDTLDSFDFGDEPFWAQAWT